MTLSNVDDWSVDNEMSGYECLAVVIVRLIVDDKRYVCVNALGSVQVTLVGAASFLSLHEART